MKRYVSDLFRLGLEIRHVPEQPEKALLSIKTSSSGVAQEALTAGFSFGGIFSITVETLGGFGSARPTNLYYVEVGRKQE